MKYSEIQSIEDVARWLEQHPRHIISAAWKEMLEQMEQETYKLEDFFEEAEYQMFDHAGGLHPDEVKG